MSAAPWCRAPGTCCPSPIRRRWRGWSPPISTAPDGLPRAADWGTRRAMIIILPALFLGIAYGIWRARRQQGDAADMAQYGAVFGLIFATLGAMLVVVLLRLG